MRTDMKNFPPARSNPPCITAAKDMNAASQLADEPVIGTLRRLPNWLAGAMDSLQNRAGDSEFTLLRLSAKQGGRTLVVIEQDQFMQLASVLIETIDELEGPSDVV